MAELERVHSSGETPKRQRGGSTVADLFPRYLELRKADPDVAGATYRDNKSDFDSRILPRWGTTPVLALEGMRQDLRSWVRELAGEVSASRCRNVVSTFRGFVGACMMEGWVPLKVNPLDTREVLTVLPNLPKKRDVVTLPREAGQSLLDSEGIELRCAVRYALALCT